MPFKIGVFSKPNVQPISTVTGVSQFSIGFLVLYWAMDVIDKAVSFV